MANPVKKNIYIYTHTYTNIYAEIKKTAQDSIIHFITVLQTTVEFWAGVGRVTVFPSFLLTFKNQFKLAFLSQFFSLDKSIV